MRSKQEILFRLLPIPVAVSLVYLLYRMTILAPAADRLLDYFFYMCISCTFIPLPTVPLIVFMGREAGPLPTALLGAVGTSLANLIDYAVFGSLCAIPAFERMRDSRAYRRLTALFDAHAFLAQVLANALPIPLDPVRFMAISRSYPRALFVLATFLGRFVRYYALAWVGFGLRLSNRSILLILAVMALLAILRAAPRLRQKYNCRRSRTVQEPTKPS